MIRKVLFEAVDGQSFPTEKEARLHEYKLQSLAQLKSILEISIRTGRIDSVLMEMMEDDTAPQVRAILAKLCQRLPRVVLVPLGDSAFIPVAA